MISRYGREPLVAGRNVPVGLLPHRGISRDLDENLDLFAKNRLTISLASSDDSSGVSTKLERLSVGSVKLAKNGIDDLFSSAEGGKHDYDWLLTPPGTPLLSASNGSGSQLTQATSRRTSSARSASTTKASRLSDSQSENNHSSRPVRSNSVTRSSSTLQHVTYSTNRSSTILNTSSASVSSYTRPSSPVSRSPSRVRPSMSSSRTASSRSSTPSRVHPVPTASSSIEKPRSIPSSRPSTPSSRAHIPANSGSPVARSTSRPSTPTRNSVPSLSGPVTSAVRSLSNGHGTTPASRPSSPSPRVRAPPQPIVPPDFPLDTPPNLITSLPDRPISAGRSRPGAAVTVKGNIESRVSLSMPKRPSSPTGTRGRLTESSGKGSVNLKGHRVDPSETRNASHSPETTTRKPVKVLTSNIEGIGLGRTISKKSIDMAIRHMDIRMGSGNSTRPLPSPTLFPQSIRSTTSKTQLVALANSMASAKVNGEPQTRKNGVIREHSNHLRSPVENGNEYIGQFTVKLSEMDISESSRYDAILLEEDVKNTNWLHSADDDDRSDIEPIFGNGFESLPEPFVVL